MLRFVELVRERIQADHLTSQSALAHVVEHYKQALSRSNDPLFQDSIGGYSRYRDAIVESSERCAA